VRRAGLPLELANSGGQFRRRSGSALPSVRCSQPLPSRGEARFIKQAPRTWYEILQHFAGQPYPPVYRALGKLRPKLGRRVDLVPAFPYTFADTEFVQGDGLPE
jgi:hypothetical protein